jgi:uncharacterized protein YuzE
MNVKYFLDTDTALLEFSDRPVAETLPFGDNLCIDVDGDGNVVSITIEHARANAKLPEIRYEEIGRAS